MVCKHTIFNKIDATNHVGGCERLLVGFGIRKVKTLIRLVISLILQYNTNLKSMFLFTLTFLTVIKLLVIRNVFNKELLVNG